MSLFAKNVSFCLALLLVGCQTSSHGGRKRGNGQDARDGAAQLPDASPVDQGEDAAVSMTDAGLDPDPETDAGCSLHTYYRDSDADGFGDPAQHQEACSQPAEWVVDATDCDDSNPRANRGRVEECSDGADNDCDGEADEDCTCREGETRSCGSAIGECSEGVQQCVGEEWSDCADYVGPALDRCDRRDNDCDGQTDEGCDCVDGETRACGSTSNVGECQEGLQVCAEGFWGSCIGEVEPSTEYCDGRDNDCDGTTDDNADSSCTAAHASGQCRSGRCEYTCVSGWDDCNSRTTDGCERDVSADAENCGGCNVVCPSGSCVAGVCEPLSRTPTGALSAGSSHACYVHPRGYVYCWGSNSSGQLGNASTVNSSSAVAVSGISDAVAVAAGFGASCAIHDDGRVSCWGSSDFLGGATTTDSSRPVAVSVTDAIAIDVGQFAACAVRANGRVVCWGEGFGGSLANGTETNSLTPTQTAYISDATSIEICQTSGCSVLAAGTVSCWGGNYYGQLGRGTRAAGVFAPGAVYGISNAISAGMGYTHGCAALSTGEVRCWGDNTSGMLGNGTTNSVTYTTGVSGISDAVAVDVSRYHSCALLSDGSVQCWGSNSAGQLGDGTTTFRRSPVDTGITYATRVSLESEHTCALLDTEDVVCWGSNDCGEAGIGEAGDCDGRNDYGEELTEPYYVTGL